MPKVEWDNLEIVEEFPAIDPNNKTEVTRNDEHADVIASIIFRAYRRSLISQQSNPETTDGGIV